jgi:hypothetical protein
MDWSFVGVSSVGFVRLALAPSRDDASFKQLGERLTNHRA